jgi:hypothetical protein
MVRVWPEVTFDLDPGATDIMPWQDLFLCDCLSPLSVKHYSYKNLLLCGVWGIGMIRTLYFDKYLHQRRKSLKACREWLERDAVEGSRL